MKGGIRGISSRFFVSASVYVLLVLSAAPLVCQGTPTASPTKVTVYDLGLNPQKFDGQLVRVQALLVMGWEGDNFLSDLTPQNLPSGMPAYLWMYEGQGPEVQVYSKVPLDEGSVQGWFTGYFHFVGKPQESSVFDPGHLQFEAIGLSMAEPSRSLANAIRKDDLAGVAMMLLSGAKINVRDEYKVTPLFEAINSRHADIAEYLIEAGADPKLKETDGSTTLMAAAWIGDLRIAMLLLDRGVSVNAADVNGQTALILASQTCPNGGIVQLLLDAGADPNAKTANGATPLMAAAGNPNVAEILIKAGADPAAKSESGQTVEDEVCDRGEKGHFEVCALVRKALRMNNGKALTSPK